MIFTNAVPSFPYQSSEATRQLGIPDSPVIHLAITSLAERLMSIANGLSISDSDMRIAALRSASGGVLFGHPFDMVVIRFQSDLGLPVEQVAIDSAANLPRRDWLGEAAQQLMTEGVAIPSDFRKHVSHYGWLT